MASSSEPRALFTLGRVVATTGALELRKVALDLVKHFNLTFARSTKAGKSTEAKGTPAQKGTVTNAPLDFELKGLDPEHEYLRGQKLTSETIRHFGLGHCSRGYFSGRVAIPLHDTDGKLVGYAGRIVETGEGDETPEYLFPSTRTHKEVTYEFNGSLLLYNAHRIRPPVHDIIIVSEFMSVWWLYQSGFPQCVAPLSLAMSEEQAALILALMEKGGKATVLAKGDASDKRFAEEASRLLSGRMQFRVVRLKDSEELTGLDPSKLKQLLLATEPPPAGRSQSSPRQAIADLANSFPCLRDFRITPETWNAEEFDRSSLNRSSGEISVAQFVLGVWNPRTAWQCGKFDLIEAAARLDNTHRHVIITWFNEPWWP